MNKDLLFMAAAVLFLAFMWVGLNFRQILEWIFSIEQKPRTPEEEWLDRQI